MQIKQAIYNVKQCSNLIIDVVLSLTLSYQFKQHIAEEQYYNLSCANCILLMHVSSDLWISLQECHASAPVSPASTSPKVPRKTLSFGDTTTMVIANPAQAERCITSDDENEVCALKNAA